MSVNSKVYEFPEQPFCLTPTLKYFGVGPCVKSFNRETAAGVYIKTGVRRRGKRDHIVHVIHTKVNAAFLKRSLEVAACVFNDSAATCFTMAPIGIIVIIIN